MEQSSQPKKIIEFNWWSIMLILAFLSSSIYLGVRTSRLSKKDQQNIATQAVLESQRDSVKAVAQRLKQRIVLLEADVVEANQNSNQAEKAALQYKRKYIELKQATPPSPCDTFIVLKECDKQLQTYENFIAILKANVLSYSRLSDTLKIENKYLNNAYDLCERLSASQKDELAKVRGKLRRHKTLNWALGGLVTGAAVVILLK